MKNNKQTNQNNQPKKQFPTYQEVLEQQIRNNPHSVMEKHNRNSKNLVADFTKALIELNHLQIEKLLNHDFSYVYYYSTHGIKRLEGKEKYMNHLIELFAGIRNEGFKINAKAMKFELHKNIYDCAIIYPPYSLPLIYPNCEEVNDLGSLKTNQEHEVVLTFWYKDDLIGRIEVIATRIDENGNKELYATQWKDKLIVIENG